MAETRRTNIHELYDRPFVPYLPRKADYYMAGAVFLVAFVVYLVTLTPYICAGDSGELTTAIYNLGAAHPPGYPLYTILGKVFTYIPVGTVAYRVNLLSAFFGALTIPFLYLFLIKLLRTSVESIGVWRDRIISAVCSLAFAFSATMWSQAVIAEVYTLNIVFAPLLLLSVLVWQERVFGRLLADQPGYGERYLLLFGFLLGMSFTNHLLLVGYIIPFAVFILAIFLIIREKTRDPLPSSSRFGYLLANGLVILLSGYFIYKHAWDSRLMHDKEAAWTIFAVFLPMITLGVSAAWLLLRGETHRSQSRQHDARRVLYGGMLVLTAALVAVLTIPSLKQSLDIMKQPGYFEPMLVVFYLALASIVFYAYAFLRSQPNPNGFTANSLGLAFKTYIFFLIPMLLYFTLVIRANAIAKIPDPPLSWGETSDAARVMNHFLRKQYPKAAQEFWSRIPEILGGWGGWHLSQFTIIPLLFVPFGLYSLFRRNRLWGWLTVSIFFFFNFLLCYFLAFRVTPRDLFFNEVFFIPSYVIVATWMAYGMQFLIDLAGRLIDKKRKPTQQPEVEQ